jgi:hypothetical protein
MKKAKITAQTVSTFRLPPDRKEGFVVDTEIPGPLSGRGFGKSTDHRLHIWSAAASIVLTQSGAHSGYGHMSTLGGGD